MPNKSQCLCRTEGTSLTLKKSGFVAGSVVCEWEGSRASEGLEILAESGLLRTPPALILYSILILNFLDIQYLNNSISNLNIVLMQFLFKCALILESVHSWIAYIDLIQMANSQSCMYAVNKFWSKYILQSFTKEPDLTVRVFLILSQTFPCFSIVIF